MAQILGQSGRYVTNQAANRKRRILITAVVIIAVVGIIEGIVIAGYLPPMPLTSLYRGIVLMLLLVLLISLSKWADVKVSQLEREQKNYESGAKGENAVSKELARFPNDFHVLNDVSTDFGNLDHVVIGPTGVYVIDAKNHRGVITADGRDGLLQNGKPNEKLNTKKFVSRIMTIKEKVDTLAGSKDVYFKALFVFTSAWIDAAWGKTGNIDCMSEEQLYKYIVEKDFGTRLKPEQVNAIARAFAQLAHMEVDFTERAKA
jgi:hypothetical protein